MAQTGELSIEVERSGGQLPLYRPRFKVEEKDLSGQERRMLAHLVEKADFFSQPGRFSLTGHPDAFEYRMTVIQSGKAHTVVFHDDDGHPESLDDLVDWLRARGH